MRNKKEKFYFEVTDTFGHELNYCWLNRYVVNAKNIRGALIKISRFTGLNFKNNGRYYKAKNVCIALYELEYEVNNDWIEKSEEI